MKNDPKLTAAPRPMKFADGTEYLLSPLTDKDISELDQWVQARFINTVCESIPTDASEEERTRRTEIAMRVSLGLTWMSGDGAKIMATVYGMTRLCWQSIRKNHPKDTEDELRAKLFDPKNIEMLRRTFASVNQAGKAKRGNAPSRQRPAQNQ